MGLAPSLCISDAAGPGVRTHNIPDRDGHIHTYIHHENRSLIHSLALMCSAIILRVQYMYIVSFLCETAQQSIQLDSRPLYTGYSLLSCVNGQSDRGTGKTSIIIKPSNVTCAVIRGNRLLSRSRGSGVSALAFQSLILS